jgi:hypothetical protein
MNVTVAKIKTATNIFWYSAAEILLMAGLLENTEIWTSLLFTGRFCYRKKNDFRPFKFEYRMDGEANFFFMWLRIRINRWVKIIVIH